MGLNDSFTATRGQILMMEPKPNLTKVFNLCSQEERQRSMKSTSNVVFQASQDTIPTESLVAAYSGGYNKSKNRPICSHCGLLGHTVNRCYKLHGYPPGYKIPSSTPRHQQQQQHAQSQQMTAPSKSLQSWPPKKDIVANNVSQDTSCISMHDHNGVHLGTVTTDQIQKLLSVLNTKPVTEQISQVSGSTLQLSDGSVSVIKPQPHLIPHTTNPFEIGTLSVSNHFISSAGIDNSLPVTAPAWVIDTGASCHVCFDLTRFTDTRLISNTVVTLPDGTRIDVTISGTVILSAHLTLFNVLFVPHFKFNLLSISALTANTSISVLFSSHSCYIFPFNPLPFIQERT